MDSRPCPILAAPPKSNQGWPKLSSSCQIPPRPGVAGFSRTFRFVFQLGFRPWGLALHIVVLEPAKGFRLAQPPAIVEVAGHSKGLVMPAPASDCAWDDIEPSRDSLFNRVHFPVFDLKATSL